MEHEYKNSWINCLTDFLNMPYYSNYSVEGLANNFDLHEKAIESILNKNKFIRYDENVFNKQKLKQWLNDPSSCPMRVGHYFYQPCGTHNKPDFVVRISESIIVPLEAKSSKGTKPQYNSGGIDPEYVYIFSSESHNKTTLYFGKDIISAEQQQIIDNLILDQKKLEKEANKKLRESDKTFRGVSYYTRPMIIQTGGSKFTDYINHPKRGHCEKQVCDYYKQLLTYELPIISYAKKARADFLGVPISSVSLKDLMNTSLGILGWAKQNENFKENHESSECRSR
jgi:hypothetical protein